MKKRAECQFRWAYRGSWRRYSRLIQSKLACWHNPPQNTSIIYIYLLSTIANAKYNTTNNKLIPHALWTDPLGSAEHERNKRSRTPLDPILGKSSLSSMLSLAMIYKCLTVLYNVCLPLCCLFAFGLFAAALPSWGLFRELFFLSLLLCA